ncbi:ATP10 protein-domain-containing protein [Myxozyma melibiosi]|uniref:ATP10 protein-domain-containing protein n=1 Tax=Myxozyma melibiosi TaxID=54550 RepID=A0ABR1FFY8_9ASCO
MMTKVGMSISARSFSSTQLLRAANKPVPQSPSESKPAPAPAAATKSNPASPSPSPKTTLPPPRQQRAGSAFGEFLAASKKNIDAANEKAKYLKEHGAQYLVRPIGMNSPPRPADNSVKDKRTFAQKRADFVSYEKNIERRKELIGQMAESYFIDMHDYRKTQGKEWKAPQMFFRADKALYMPNFHGTTLASSAEKDTTSALKGKVSVVKLYSQLSGEHHVDSYFGSSAEAIADVSEESGYQTVDITVPDRKVNKWISKFFAFRTRRKLPKSRHDLFFYAQPLPDQLSHAIGQVNKYTGYVYIVDGDCKIRWAACAKAMEEEKESFRKCLKGVVAEHKVRLRKSSSSSPKA